VHEHVQGFYIEKRISRPRDTLGSIPIRAFKSSNAIIQIILKETAESPESMIKKVLPSQFSSYSQFADKFPF